jgi:hypothetical protein
MRLSGPRWAAAALVLLGQALTCQGETPVIRNAARVTLSNGQVVSVLATMTPRQTGRVNTVIFIGDLGGPVVFTEEADTVWDQLNLSVADGGRKLVMRFHIGYVADGMPGPAELQIESRVFRWLSKEGGEMTPQKRAMQKAVSELPEALQKDLVTFATLCAAATAELVLPPSGFIVPELFADQLPRVAAQSIEKLNPDEVSKIFQDSAGDFLSRGSGSEGQGKAAKTPEK